MGGSTMGNGGSCPKGAIFTDLHAPLGAHAARVEAERCYFCYDAPCATACPTSIDIPLFIRQIATGNDLGAAETILASNIMGSMCARVCPTEQLCEEACVRNAGEQAPVQIGLLQRHATDALLDDGRQIFTRAAPTGKVVAVVGAGPAGLACAHALALAGHAVTVFEARPKAGGLNEYGIAAYKAVGNIAQREVDYILGLGGIEIRHGSALGADVTLDGLAAGFDAVFLGLGLGAVNAAGIEGAGLAGIADAVGFIARLRQGEPAAVGRRVVVIGGGMTAIDVAVQARLLGAEDVTIVYRGDEAAMKASPYEREVARTRDVRIRTCLRPKRYLGENGRVTAAEFAYAGGTGETLTLPADQVFEAVGQKLAPPGLDGLAFEGGRIKVDGERATSRPGVWAGGDCIAGGKDLTVAAVEDGKVAARAIDHYLKA
ncbi:dihydropyrimidine dehydrogenase [Zavarzinia compransoris]|uniref:Dihydropyrimidine dehydrogenase n=2 Tax=Zavarzinia compransoris TaxID=1264899 RepID=A0A317DWB1_9PROT|nr:dihydropyrimidine dehydrogenase [Zavarzinia compransoris]